MRTKGASRAILIGDSPSELQTANGVLKGNVVPNQVLRSAVEEVAPYEAIESFNSFSTADFRYKGFRFQISSENDILRFEISPEPIPATIPPVHTPVTPITTSAVVQPPVYGAPQPANNSGMGAASTPPAELQGFNWGAFCLPLFWSIAHSTWIGLLSLIPVFGLAMNVVLGLKGNEWAWSNRRFLSIEQFKQVQKTWATAGLVVVLLGSCVSLPIFAISTAVVAPVFGRARQNAIRSSCQSNLKQIALGIKMYQMSNGDKYPAATSGDQLMQQLQSTVNPKLFQCQNDNTTGTSDYVYNKRIAGLSEAAISDGSGTPMLWDKDGIEHLGGRNVAFTDGHVKWLRESEFQRLIAPYR